MIQRLLALALLGLVASLALAPPAHAQSVCGPVPFGEVWSTDVTVNCDLNIAGLTIEPGVQVSVAGNYQIVVSGTIRSLGTPSSPVTFKPTPDNTEGWKGFYFEDTVPGSEFRWTTIEGTNASALHLVRSTPLLHGVTFRGNSASHGAAILVELQNDDLIVEVGTFENNYADVAGGAIYVVGPTEPTAARVRVSSSAFVQNKAGTTGTRHNTSGGAIYANGNIEVEGSTFLGNLARSYTIYAAGGRYSRGGGLFLAGGHAWVHGSRFIENGVHMGAHSQTPDASRAYGGDICVQGGELALSRSLLAKGFLSVSRNPDLRGSGVYVAGGVACLTHVTIADGSRQGVYAQGGMTIVLNSILWGNSVAQISDPSGTLTATFSNVQQGWPGQGNSAYNPVFIDPLHDNYHLSSGSPCIDAGDPGSAPDLDGSRADMGAFQTSDCNANGLIDADDIAVGSSQDVNINGLPDECECFAYSFCQAGANSAGGQATMNIAGTPSVSQNAVVLLANGCPPNKPGLFYYGTQQVETPFGDGFRCVGGATYRLYTFAFTDGAGTATRPLDLTNPPQGAGQVTPYSHWNFQFWYRDPVGPGGNGFNLSDGLEIVFCP